jgi:hypothetical protein
MTFVFVDRHMFSEKKWEKLKSRLRVNLFFVSFWMHLMSRLAKTPAAKSKVLKKP